MVKPIDDDGHYDAVIVGAGISGAILAKQLIGKRWALRCSAIRWLARIWRQYCIRASALRRNGFCANRHWRARR